MRRVALVALLLALAISAGVNWTSARTTAQSGGDLLRLLPDGGGVALVDVQRVTSSSFWSSLASQASFKKTIDSVEAKLASVGVRLSDIQTAAVVFSPSGMKEGPAIAVSGAFNQNDLIARLREQPNMKVTPEKYKGVDLFEVVSGSSSDRSALLFHDARTIIAGSPEAVRASIDVRSGARPSIAQNNKLAPALASNAPAAVSFAMETPAQMANAGKSAPIPLPDFSTVRLIFGTVDLTTAIDINATLRTDKAEDARNITDRLNGLLDMARAYLGALTSDPKMAGLVQALKTVSITGNDIDVKITGSLPQEILTQLLR